MQSNDRAWHILPDELPWGIQATLLLDGISVESLQRRLYEWSSSPSFEPLYLSTRWAELSDVSPCLVRLSGLNDPILVQFMEHADAEWGYLLFSEARWEELLAHLRWLVTIRHPLGEDMLLRLADPAVANALFGHAVENADATLFGPFERIVAADSTRHLWHQYQRPESTVSLGRHKPYPLSDAQLELLGEVSMRNTVIQLDTHMHEFFPSYQPRLAGPARWEHLHELASTAYAQGFSSERDITLYANIFGFLGERALDDHPDIARLLTQKSLETPAQRIERAAELAEKRAEHMEGNSI
ncbi:DUF4123 domain-containing protein [Pseudomonas sp. GCM10022188]|uniref:DUF4123 domain-containing protein n=1 Tax=Pseudomonas TaxID=286 RepID=UPI001E4F6539|nr:DUF4123 domain-containing protein [Pseudomonas oryzagri]MCC6075593.1 DUF4123 domain-containing protein [Pseudomonas oryzagri]